MAWNEPGKRDPWKGGNKSEPPDMDDMLRRLRDRFSGFFGSGGPSHSSGLLLIVPALILIWIGLTSWTKVDARQIGVVLRFGQFNRVMTSGLNLKWPTPIEQVISVEATNVRSISDEVRMLTKDENIVVVDFNVQYHVGDARQYLFAAAQPDETLKQAAESAVRQVVGRSDMDTILSGQGTEAVSETEKLLQQTLEGYAAGLIVDSVNFQKILPPPDVKEAFDDANNAGNNQKQYVNEAQAYAAQMIPLARGDAAQIRARAAGDKAARIAAAEGDAQRFNLIESQYKAAPEVTRKRLYLEAMQSVLATTTKIVDQSNGKSILYIPLDKNHSDPAAAAAAVDELRNGNRGGGQ